MKRYLPILTFHAIEDGSSPLAFAPRLFREVLRGIAAHAWRALSLREALARFDRGGASSEPFLALTFDDGFRSVFAEAFPVLRDLGMTATVFLRAGAAPAPAPAPEGEATAVPQRPAGRLPPHAGRELMSWEEVHEMSAAGIEFGGHTRTHPDLTRLADDRLREEILGGKREIERATGLEVRSFAYPFGRWNARVRREAQQHFACACSDRLALASAESDRFALPRIDAHYLRSPGRAGWLFSRYLPLYVQGCNAPRAARRRFLGLWNREPD